MNNRVYQYLYAHEYMYIYVDMEYCSMLRKGDLMSDMAKVPIYWYELLLNCDVKFYDVFRYNTCISSMISNFKHIYTFDTHSHELWMIGSRSHSW
jgi:hypothetical protein